MRLFDWQKECFLDSEAKYNVIPAGRRTGKTMGASLAAMINCTQGEVVLWVDTVNGNIDRYVERYFIPVLREEGLRWRWNAQKRTLKIESSYIDFRSADRPETIEGFGYSKIYLNEAGIILNNDYLYTNSILPMLLDYEDSQLYAFGTPKGQVNKNGDPHRFYELWKNTLSEKGKKNPIYAGRQLSSYDNPTLKGDEITALKEEMAKISQEAVRQEIHAEFVEQSDELLFTQDELSFFKMDDLNNKLAVGKFGGIDVADEGLDFLSYPIGYVIGDKIYVTDWYFTRDNTELTIPVCTALTRQHALDFLAVETNNHGSVFFKQIFREIRGTKLIGVNQKSKKHERIVNMAHFIRTRMVFREDVKANSHYAEAMKNLFTYKKNGKSAHDDAPDSLALLSGLVRDIYPHIF